MSVQTENGKKSLWELPGGKMGTVVAGLLIGGGLLLFYKLLPSLIVLAENTLYLAAMCAIIAFVIFLFTDKKIRQTVKIGYFMLMRKITSMIIEIDPIAIVERRVLDMKKKIQQISRIMGELKGHIRNAESEIVKDKKNMEDTIRKAKWHQEQGDRDSAVIQERQAVRLSEGINDQIKNLNDSKKWYEILCKVEKMAQLTVEDTENEVDARKKAFERIRKQHKAFKSVQSIIDGNPDEMAIFNQAMDFMALDMDKKLGEMEHVITNAGGLLTEFNASNGVASMKAKELFAKYDSEGIESIFNSFSTLPSGETKPELLAAAQMPINMTYTPYEVIKLDEVRYF